EHGDAEPDLVLVHQRHAAQDDVLGLEPLDPLPARGGREPDLLTDFGDGQGGVLLQDGQDLAVDGVEAAVLGGGGNGGGVTHAKNIFLCNASIQLLLAFYIEEFFETTVKYARYRKIIPKMPNSRLSLRYPGREGPLPRPDSGRQRRR